MKVNLAIRVHQGQLVALAYTNEGRSAPGTLRRTGKPFEVAFGQPLALSCRGVAQLVAHLLWEQEAGGSSPPSPTKNPRSQGVWQCFVGSATCVVRVACAIVRRPASVVMAIIVIPALSQPSPGSSSPRPVSPVDPSTIRRAAYRSARLVEPSARAGQCV